MKTNRMMDGAGYLMSATQQRREDDEKPSELGQRLLDKWAAQEAAAGRMAAAYRASATRVLAQKMEMAA